MVRQNASQIARAKVPDTDMLDGKDSTDFEQLANKDAVNGYAGLSASGLLAKADCVTSANISDSQIHSEHHASESGYSDDTYDPPSQSYSQGRTTIRTWTIAAHTAGVILRASLPAGDAVNSLSLILQIRKSDDTWVDFLVGSATSQTTFQLGDGHDLTGAFDIRGIRLQVNNPNAGSVTFNFAASSIYVLGIPRSENSLDFAGV